MRLPQLTRFATFYSTRVFPTIVSVLAAILVPAASAPAVDTDFHYLAADPSLRAQVHGCNLVMGRASYVGEVLRLDQSWEAPFTLGYPGGIVTDPVNGEWRMYYELIKSNTERFAAMAVSNDGVHWTKPALNVSGTTYTANPLNNFVHLPQTWMGGPSVFVDPNAPADQRYRMCMEVGEKVLYALASADGLNWRTVGTIDNAPGNYRLDAHNTAFWDPKTQKYLAYMRWWYSAPGKPMDRRGVFTRRSNAWDTTWPDPREFTIDPKDALGANSRKPDLYTPGVMPYYGQYIGLPALYYHPDGNSGPICPVFMYSRDGGNWSFPNSNHSIIDLAAHGQNEQTFNGMVFAMSSLAKRDGNLYIYYTYQPQNHEETRTSPTFMYLATLREDRFVGVQSIPDGVGKWTTSAITLPADPGRLVLNAVVGDGGSVLVEVLDSQTLQPLPGFTAKDGLSIGPGDYLDAQARWNGINDLNALAGQTVALRFVMDNAVIYSFHFEALPEPSTLVLLATGLVVLVWCARRK